MSRARLNVFLEPNHAKRLDELACMKRVPKSGIVAAALASYLSPDGADRREALVARRLESLCATFGHMQRDQMILVEALALFIRHHFAITPPIPESQQEAARAQSKARFEQFIEQVARNLQRGDTLVQDIVEELSPTPNDRSHKDRSS